MSTARKSQSFRSSALVFQGLPEFFLLLRGQLISYRYSHPEKFPCRIVPRLQDASVEKLTKLTGLGPFVNSTCEF